MKDEATKYDSTATGSWFAKKKEEQAAGPSQRLSASAELRSDKTLAALALKESGASPKKRKIPDTPSAVPSTSAASAAQKRRRSQDEAGTSTKKLPRRDRMPGESPPRKREPPAAVASTSTPSRKANGAKATPEPKPKPKPRTTRRPFSKLLEGVVFTISGYQNPLRGVLRQKATDMGARYKGDWDASCTHLLCAFANTPKFNQVKKSRHGKIVAREWVERCHEDRKRYPWRRYCLDKADKRADESEEEVWAEGDDEEDNSDDEPMDTDDEIEAVR